jgi:hypothetical protein
MVGAMLEQELQREHAGLKRLLGAVGSMAIIAAMSASLSAQWPPHRAAGVPMTPDGKPDLTAPAPRTADGKPDFSGNWIRGDGQLGPAGGGTVGGPAPVFSSGPPVTTFRDVGANYKGGLPLQPWAADLVKARRAENSKENPDAHCLPMGLMQFHNHGQPRKMIQTPGLMVIVYEANYGLRYIFTDGRTLPGGDAQPWWYGYSTGKWDGDTLVVETSGFRDGGWLDIIGNPLTDAAKLTERFRRPNFGTLEIDVTIDDPKAYTKPWTVRVNQRIMLDSELLEFICLENQKFESFLKGAGKSP